MTVFDYCLLSIKQLTLNYLSIRQTLSPEPPAVRMNGANGSNGAGSPGNSQTESAPAAAERSKKKKEEQSYLGNNFLQALKDIFKEKYINVKGSNFFKASPSKNS